MKICLVCSPGGHLTQTRRLEKFYRKYDYFFVTFFSKLIEELVKQERFHFVTDPRRNLYRFLVNIFQSLKVFLKERPDVIISTGAGVAIAMCWWARIFGRRVIFIEDWCVVEKPSLSGRMVYPIASLFIIQWEQLQKYYPKARFKGALI
jgi:UDP-N-acetylglucosamine:LPS N-acetylglucosamine transferase